MKNFKLSILYCLVLLVVFACKKKDEPIDLPSPPTQEELFYTNCGKIPPILGCLNGAKFFVPNSFSPNSDGFNDALRVYTGTGVSKIDFFRVFDENGEVVFEKDEIDIWNGGNPSNGWDGTLLDGSVQEGIYNYKIRITNLMGNSAEFDGAVCVRTSNPINCVEHEKHLAWGTQHNGNGGFSSALPSYEDCE